MNGFRDYKTGLDEEMILNLSSFLPSDHLCFIIEQIVSSLDVSSIEAEYSPKGRNAIHPKMMLSIIFYGYTIGTRSGRNLATACSEQLPFIYLSKGCQPKKTSINNFRMNHFSYFSELFVQVLRACREAGLGVGSLAIVDGTKLLANSSMGRTKDQAYLEKWHQILLEDIACLEEMSKPIKKEVKKKRVTKNV